MLDAEGRAPDPGDRKHMHERAGVSGEPDGVLDNLSVESPAW
jgi:hypothetical protein